MITQTSDRSIDVDYDIFSFAGRTALLGGGAYAIGKSISNGDIKYKRDLTHRVRENSHIQSVKESQKKDLINSLANTQSEIDRRTAQAAQDMVGLKPNKSFSKLVSSPENGFTKINFSDLYDPSKGVNFFSGGYKGRSKDLPSHIDRLLKNMNSADGYSPNVHVKFDKFNQVSELKIKGDKTTFYLNASDQFGFSGGSVQRPSWKYGVNGQIDVVGTDVLAAEFYADNVGKFNDKSISMKEFKERERANHIYSDKGYNTGIEPKRANPEKIEQILESAGYDFTDYFRGGAAKDSKYIQEAITKHSMQYPGTSANDLARNIVALADAPTNNQKQNPFLDITNNPKQSIRDMGILQKNNTLKYKTEKNVLFLEEDVYNELRKANRHLGELADEEVLLMGGREDMLIDKTRSLTIDSEKMGESANHIIKQMSNVSGLSEDEIAKKISEGGFDSFKEEHVEAFKKISLNSHEEYLKEELRKSAQKRKSLLKSNTSKQVVMESEEFKTLENTISNLKEQRKRSKILGASADGLGTTRLGKEYKNSYLDNIIYSEKNKTITFQAMRKRIAGPGTKIMDSAGEVKAIVKRILKNGGSQLSQAYINYVKKKGLTFDAKVLESLNTVDMVLPISAIKKDVYSRNANSAYYSIKEKAKADNNKRILDIFNSHESNLEGMSEAERLSLWNKLDEASEGKGLTHLIGDDVSIGKIVKKNLAYGSLPEDMGYGKDMFFSERQINHLHALGLKDYVDELKSKRSNIQAAKAHYEFSNDQSRLFSKGGKTDFSIQETKHDSFLKGVFPSLSDTKGNIDNKGLLARKEFLKQRGVEGTAFVSLGETVEGIDKIAIYNTEHLIGHVGKKIGSYDRYSELDALTRRILLMANNPVRDEKKFKELIRNYKETTKQLGSTLTKNLDKGKSGAGLTLRVTSASEGMKEYVAARLSKSGTKTPLDLVAAISEENYIKYYGKEALDEFYNVQTLGDKATKEQLAKASRWGMGIREPVEGSSALALNIIPSKDVLKDEVAMLTKHNPKGDEKGLNKIWSVLKAVFGDTDGDAMTVGFAQKGGKASARMEELVYGNSAQAIAYRRAQELKMKVSLKGLEQKTLLENIRVDFSEAKEAAHAAKVLEKQAIGIVSDALKPLHSLNAQKYAGAMMTDLDFEKYMSNETFMHVFTENVLKGKFQSIEQLRSKHSMYTLHAFLGTEEFMKASITDRMKNLREFTDNLVFGEHAHVADKLRNGMNLADLTKDNPQMAADLEKVNLDAWKQMTNEDSIKGMVELADESKRATNTVVDAANLAAEEMKGTKKGLDLVEETMETTKDITKMLNGVGSNMLKYAVLPAAAFGVLGTIFHSKSRISQEGEYSDNKQKHDGSSSKEYGFSLEPNIQNPKYMQPNISGSAKTGFQIDKYTAIHKTSDVRLTDHTRSFDRLDMKDKMDRGY